MCVCLYVYKCVKADFITSHFTLLHFIDAVFFTGWKQNPPSVKTLWITSLWYLLYWGGLEQNLPYLRGMPICQTVCVNVRERGGCA